jgi:hypothetical protein
MALAIVATVRNALSNGQQLRQSDLLALLAITDQLWAQTQAKGNQTMAQQGRREYMRLYMRRYRAQRRVQALTDHGR